MKTPYSKNDDENLVKYLAHLGNDVGRMGKTIYKDLTDHPGKYPWAQTHPWQSWRQRYKNNPDKFDSKVKRYQEAGIVDESCSSSEEKPSTQRGSQTPFTKDEDALLTKYLALHNPTVKGRRGNRVYKELVANVNKHWSWSTTHSWESWRHRYLSRRGYFDKRILVYQRNKGIDPAKPKALPKRPVKRQKVEVEKDSQEDQWAQLHNQLALPAPQQTKTTVHDADAKMGYKPTSTQKDVDVSKSKAGPSKHKDDDDDYTDASDTEDSRSDDNENQIFEEDAEEDELDASEEEDANDKQDNEDEINVEEINGAPVEHTTNTDTLTNDLDKEPDNNTPSTSIPQSLVNANPNVEVENPSLQTGPVANAPPTPPPEFASVNATVRTSHPLKRRKSEIDEDPFGDPAAGNVTPRVQSRKKRPPVINESTFGNRLSSKRNRIADDDSMEEQEGDKWPPKRASQRFSTTRDEFMHKQIEEQRAVNEKGKARESNQENGSETEDSATEASMPLKCSNHKSSITQVRPLKISPRKSTEERGDAKGKGREQTQTRDINQENEPKNKVVVLASNAKKVSKDMDVKENDRRPPERPSQRVDAVDEDDPMGDPHVVERCMKGKDKAQDSLPQNEKYTKAIAQTSGRPSLAETEVNEDVLDRADEDRRQQPDENTNKPRTAPTLKFPRRKTDVFNQAEGPTPSLFKRHSEGNIASTTINIRLPPHDSNRNHSQNVSRTINLRQELANKQRPSSRLSTTTLAREQSIISEEEHVYLQELGKQQAIRDLSSEFGFTEVVIKRLWDELKSMKAVKETLTQMKSGAERRMSKFTGLPLKIMGSEEIHTHTPMSRSSQTSMMASSSRMSLLTNSSTMLSSQSGEKLSRKRKRVSDVSDVSMIGESGGGGGHSLEIRPIDVEDVKMEMVYEPPRKSRAGKFARLMKMGREEEALMREQKRVGYLALSPKRSWIQDQEQEEEEEGPDENGAEAEAEEEDTSDDDDEEKRLVSDSEDEDGSVESGASQNESEEEKRQESAKEMEIEDSQGRINVTVGVSLKGCQPDEDKSNRSDRRSHDEDGETGNENGEGDDAVQRSEDDMDVDSSAPMTRHQHQSIKASEDDSGSTLDSEQDDENQLHLKIDEKPLLKIESSSEIDLKYLKIRDEDVDESDSGKDVEEVEALVRNGIIPSYWEEVEARFWSANRKNADILRAAEKDFSPEWMVKRLFSNVD